VAFLSDASNLVSGDTNSQIDVFVRNLQTGTNSLVSQGTGGSGANGRSYFPRLSTDGRYVVFSSDAGNLVSGDTNGAADVFVRDLQAGTTALVSRASDGTLANTRSFQTAISADGRYVAFASTASNLVSGDTNGKFDIFLRDLQTGTTTLVSQGLSGAGANDDSFSSFVSSDGRYVAFYSNASNLVSGDTNGSYDVFLRDVQAATTTLVTQAPDGSATNSGSESWSPSVSADGQHVAFSSNATNLVSAATNRRTNIFRWKKP